MTTIELNEPLLEASRSNSDAGLIRRLFRRRREFREERATLMELTRMQPHLLRDMGIEPGDPYVALDGGRSAVLYSWTRKRGAMTARRGISATWSSAEPASVRRATASCRA